MKNETTQSKEYKFSFKKLTPEKKKELLYLQSKNNENTFVFSEKLSIIYWLIIAASLGWIAYLFYSSQNILWDGWVFWMNLGLTVIAVPALALSLVKVSTTILSKKNNGHIFTPNEFIKVKDDCVQIWNLKQIESVRVVEDDEQLEVWSGKHEERIDLSDSKALDEARQIEGMFDSWKLNAKNEFVSGCDESKLAYSPSGKMIFSFALVIVSVLAAVGMSFAAKSANVAYDDDVMWKQAEKIGTIDEIEKYKEKYPKGRHIAEADKNVSEKLAKIKDDYSANTKESADAEAVEVLTEILDETIKSADRRIYVKAKEVRELDPEIIEKMKEKTGFSVSSYEYTVPASNENFRKEKILNDTKLMFRDIAKEGAIEFVLSDDPPEKSPVVEVNYVIKSFLDFYQYDLFSNGRMTTSYYPALEFVFDFALRSGTSPKEYKTSYTIMPKRVKPVFYNVKDADNYSFDKKLFSTASEDFGVYLGEKFGFKEITAGTE